MDASYSNKELNHDSDSQDQQPLHMPITRQNGSLHDCSPKATVRAPASHKTGNCHEEEIGLTIREAAVVIHSQSFTCESEPPSREEEG